MSDFNADDDLDLTPPPVGSQYHPAETEDVLLQIREIIDAARPVPLSASSMISREEVLELVDEADYGKSWAAAASMFKAAVTEAQWEAAVAQARGPFEPMGARQFLGAKYLTELPGAPKGQYVVMQYQVMAADNTKLVETITPMLDTDGTWRVSGYYVRRP